MSKPQGLVRAEGLGKLIKIIEIKVLKYTLKFDSGMVNQWNCTLYALTAQWYIRGRRRYLPRYIKLLEPGL
jgi:hypothetical protein